MLLLLPVIKMAAEERTKQQVRDSGQSEETVGQKLQVLQLQIAIGNAVTSGSDGSIVTSGPKTKTPVLKIVCTEMYFLQNN